MPLGSGGSAVKTLPEVLMSNIDVFLDHLANQRNAAPNTVVAYRNDLRQFRDYLSGVRSPLDGSNAEIHPLDPGTVASFVLYLRDRGYAEATVARKIAAVKSFFHYASTSGLVSDNPTATLGSPRVPRSIPQGIDPGDVQALLEIGCAGDTPDDLRDRAMLTLLYHSGMRVSELVALNVEDVDLEGSTVQCRGRAGRVRWIPLPSPASGLVREYLARGRPALTRSANGTDGALFLNHRGNRLTRQGFWLIMKECGRRAGILDPVTPHALRHSFALQHLGSGTSLRDLKELLGHVNISTTQIYTLASRNRPSNGDE